MTTHILTPNPSILYMSSEAHKLPTGTYLGLFHGRDTATEHVEDWSYHGPIIGPITGYHTTYEHHIRVGFPSREAARVFFPDAYDNWVDLTFNDGCLEYAGKFYGDWTVHQHTNLHESALVTHRLRQAAGFSSLIAEALSHVRDSDLHSRMRKALYDNGAYMEARSNNHE